MINSVAGINMVNFFDNYYGCGRHFNFADDGCYVDGKIHCFSFCNKSINK